MGRLRMKGLFSTATLPPSPELIATGWALLTATTASEIFSGATHPQAVGFYRALGGRIARLGSVDGVEDLSDLAQRVNMVWRALEFGEADMLLDLDAVIIQHRSMPVLLTDDPDKCWPLAAQALLEGAYDHWFHSLGSRAPISTRVVSMTDTIIALRHGR